MSATLPMIVHGADVDDAVIAGVIRNARRIGDMLARGGYFATSIIVRPDWHEDYRRCDEYDFENWAVGYAPGRPVGDFRRYCGQIHGCLAGVLDEVGALPEVPR